jgi:hypothetical protein
VALKCDGNCPQARASIAVSGEDGDVVMSDSEVVSGECGGTANITQLANDKWRVWLQLGKHVTCGGICGEMR